MEKKRPLIGVTLGDAAGIGPEIVAKAASSGALEAHGQPVLFASEREWKRAMEIAGVHVPYEVMDSVSEAIGKEGIVLIDTSSFDPDDYAFGVPSKECGENSAVTLRHAINSMMEGHLDAVCFGPNNKEMMKKAGFKLNGAIDLVSGFMGYQGDRGELSVLGDLWTARVTSHIPLMEVTANLSIDRIVRTILLLDRSKKAAGYENPHIAVAALNPHAGEGGTCGREEIDLIQPAIKEALLAGVHVQGPVPADTLFYNLLRGSYDSAVTMFHDQGQIAMKLNGFDAGVTVMGGLPYPVTTCSHGTAYDIAGKGVANSGAFASSYALAAKMGAHMKTND